MRVILAAAVLLSGCATGTSGSSSAEGAMCNANPAEKFVGRPLEGNQEAAQRAASARVVRTYITGSALTMDFRQDRLNIETTPEGIITQVSCG